LVAGRSSFAASSHSVDPLKHWCMKNSCMNFIVYCYICQHIYKLWDVIIMLCFDFGVFDFPGATGLEKGQGKWARLGNFEMSKMRWSGPSGHKQAANEMRWHGHPSRPRYPCSFASRASDVVRIRVVLFVLT
jgi:hypothetical protein